MEHDEVKKLFNELKCGDTVLIYPRNRVNPIKATFVAHTDINSFWNKYIFEINERTSAFETENERWAYSSRENDFIEKVFGVSVDNRRRILIRRTASIKIIKKLEDKK